jgi:uncharacterized protein
MGSPRGLQHHLRGYLYSNPLAYVYTSVYSMVFTWDPRKSHANLEERGFDFEFASLIFRGATLETEDRRKVYGERRWVAIGVTDGLHLTVVYTDRSGTQDQFVRRIISARRSNKREREAYQKAFEAGNPQSGTGRPASHSGND